MRKLALGSLVFASLLVIATAIFLVFAREQDRGGASFRGALRESSPTEELAILTSPSTPDVTQRREVDEEQSRTASKTAAVCSLHGFVLPASGSADMPLDKLVELVDERSAVEWTRIDEHGAYSLEHLVPGHYWLTSGSSREDRAWAEVVLDPNVPSQRVDLRLEPWSELRIRIRVVDTEGRALENRELTPIATSQPPGDWFDEMTSNRNNHFGVGQYSSAHRDDKTLDGSIGYLLLDAEPPVYVSLVRGMRVVATKLVDALDNDVVFTIDRGSPLLRNASVRWRCVNPSPVFDNCYLSAAIGAFDDSPKPSVPSKSGVHLYENVRPGLYGIEFDAVADDKLGCPPPPRVEVSHDSVRHDPDFTACYDDEGYVGTVERTLRLRLDAGEERDLGEILRSPGRDIAGRVRDVQGNDIDVNVWCAAYDPAQHAVINRRDEFPEHASGGAFRIRGLEPGQYVLRVNEYAAWAAPCVLVDTREKSVCDVELRVTPPVKCSLRPSLASWRAQRFELRNELGLPIIGVKRFESPRPRELLLAPGRYELRSWILPSSTPTTRTIELANEALSIDLP